MDLQDWKIKDYAEKEIGSCLKLKQKKSCKSVNQENHDADNLLGEMQDRIFFEFTRLKIKNDFKKTIGYISKLNDQYEYLRIKEILLILKSRKS